MRLLRIRIVAQTYRESVQFDQKNAGVSHQKLPNNQNFSGLAFQFDLFQDNLVLGGLQYPIR